MTTNDLRDKLTRLHGNLMNYALRLTPNRETARELVEHTTEIALERWGGTSDGAMLKGWVFAIMRGLFTSEYSRRTALTSAVGNDIYSIRLSEASSIAVRPEGSHSSANVTRVLSSFTSEYRKAVELYFTGYSMGEIAGRLNLPLAVVKSRVSFCCNRLRSLLSA